VTIGDQVKATIDRLNAGDMESALIHLSSAFDDTAKKEYPKEKKISERIKKLLRDNQDVITFFSFGGNFFSEHKIDDLSLEDVLYKALRCGLQNDGTISNEIEFVDDMMWGKPDGKLCVPVTYLFGSFLVIIGAPGNSHEKVPESYDIRIIGNSFKINNLWGQMEYIREIMKNPGKVVKQPS